MTAQGVHHRASLEALQLEKLQRLIAVLRERNAFYRARLERAGVDASIASIDEFAETCPPTTKQELLEDQMEHPPYGTNLSFNLKDYVRLHQTSSTTGRPLRWLDTAESWNSMVDDWVEILRVAGVTALDHVLAAFSFGPFIGFWLGFEAAQRIGCLSIPGGAMNSATRLRVILANNVTVLLCTPTYAIRLGEAARDEGIDLSAASVRTMIVAGEPGGSLPTTRRRIETLWPTATLFDHHGMTEIGPATYQCPDRIGSLHLLESSLLCEFIDRETARRLPVQSNEVGELVVTTLNRTGSPLLRYRTGDLVRPGDIAGPCSCGRIERTLEGGVIARADDMVFVRGVNVYPSTVDQLVREQQGVAEYRVEVREERGMIELRIFVEPESDQGDGESVKKSIAEAIRNALNLRVPVEIAPPQTLPRFEFKSRRWVRVGVDATETAGVGA